MKILFFVRRWIARSPLWPVMAWCIMAPLNVFAGETQLYDTGPGEDASFIRFVNATNLPMEVLSGGKRSVTMEVDSPVTDFFPVSAGKPIKGSMVAGRYHKDIQLTLEPGEFLTVVGTLATAGLAVTPLRESPDDFNALRASLAFFNMDRTCQAASLWAQAQDAVIFKAIAFGARERTSINPLNLTVEIRCADQSRSIYKLGKLERGKRYSLILVGPGSKKRLFFAPDTISK